MATFSVIKALSLKVDDSSTYISPNVRATDDYFIQSGFLNAPAKKVNSISSSVPISSVKFPIVAIKTAKSFLGNSDFYNRIIVSTPFINAGNIITNQTYNFSVWNGYFIPQTLNSINAAGNDGLTLIPQVAPPTVFAPIEEQFYTLNVSTNGSSALNATYTLNFTAGPATINVVGQRIFAWNHSPDWSRPLIERLEWVTNIIASENNTEQRISVRLDPKRSIEYQFGIVDADVRRKFEVMLYSWGARTWLLPLWTEGQNLPGTLFAGATTIALSRITKDYFEGGNAIIRTAAYDFEIVEISTIVGNTLNFKRQTVKNWGVDAVIYPAFSAYLEPLQKVDRFTGDSLSGICRFRLLQDVQGPADSPTLYRGKPVLTDAPVWVEDLTMEYARILDQLDFTSGSIIRDDNAGMPFVVINHTWLVDTKSKIDLIRAFVFSRSGRQKMLWIPTFLNDMQLAANIGSSSSSIDINFSFITQHLNSKIGRRDIRIELNSGLIYYRRVIGASEVNESVERISLDSPIPLAYPIDDVSRISWMIPARLDSDAVEFAWMHDDVMQCSVNWRSVCDDV